MKIFSGKVVAKKMQNTATVEVVRTVVHPMYKKRYRKVKKYHVHDKTDAQVGQRVKFVACRPYSKIKKWKIVEVVGNKKIKSIKKVVKKEDK
ncbi:MAG: 30S ribosomal protein S17 [bacterium]|nr:30S ribosomal protein S17 [bacterium]